MPAEREENLGKFYNDVSAKDRISLSNSIIGILTRTNYDFKFLYEFDGLRSVEFAILSCCSDKSKDINMEKYAPVITIFSIHLKILFLIKENNLVHF